MELRINNQELVLADNPGAQGRVTRVVAVLAVSE